MQVVLEQITHWLSGRFDDNAMFKAELRPDGLIVLEPRQESMTAVLQRIELYLDARPGIIDRVLIYEGPDAYTQLSFSGTVLNQALAADVFRKAP
jgi:hypothetical protein